LTIIVIEHYADVPAKNNIMKKNLIVLALLITCGFSLSAQENEEGEKKGFKKKIFLPAEVSLFHFLIILSLSVQALCLVTALQSGLTLAS